MLRVEIVLVRIAPRMERYVRWSCRFGKLVYLLLRFLSLKLRKWKRCWKVLSLWSDVVQVVDRRVISTNRRRITLPVLTCRHLRLNPLLLDHHVQGELVACIGRLFCFG